MTFFETPIRASTDPRGVPSPPTHATRDASEVGPADDQRATATFVRTTAESTKADYRPRETPYTRHGKRLLNIGLLCVALPLSLVPGVPIALLNALLFRDPRRVFFRQVRIGYRGREFSIWKFRTMQDETPEGEFESWSQGQDDERVTRFGRFLRSTHLDELPQLLNILAGEMDFIGPRPEMRSVHRWASERIPQFDHRTALRPGITGLAQVTQGYVGCDEQAYRTKLAADLEYGRRLSLGLDVQILLRTLTWMLMGRGWNRIEVQDPAHAAGQTEVAGGAANHGQAAHQVATMEPCPAPIPAAPLTVPQARRRVTPSPGSNVHAPATSPMLSSSSTTQALGTPSAQAD